MKLRHPLISEAEQIQMEKEIQERIDQIFSESPPPQEWLEGLSSDQKQALSDATKMVLQAIQEDPTRDGLIETPRRVAKAWADELFTGYQKDPHQIATTFPAESQDLVIVNDLPVYSFCEHHILPIVGVAHIAYIPDQKILGLSKFGRVVDVFARRLQVQERLTAQVADSLMEILEPRGVIVIIEARHMCMEMRGISAYNTWTKTSAIRGLFDQDTSARSEALSLMRK